MIKKYILLFLNSWFLYAATTTSITQFGVTFTFDSAVEYGQFANGDYWVQTPVTINSMTPDWTGTGNGWEVNPNVHPHHGFDSRSSQYTSADRPALPFTIDTNATVVKVISGTFSSSDSKIKTAVALTCLITPPPDPSTNYFRPPYMGTNKPLYRVDSMLTNLLPSLSISSVNTPTLSSIKNRFDGCLMMDHTSHNSFSGSRPRELRPDDVLQDYQPENTQMYNEAMLRLCLNDSLVDKHEALVYFTQVGIDRAYAITNGYRRIDNGHNPNHRVVGAWAATLLDMTDVIAYMSTASGFHEDEYIQRSSVNNMALWGRPGYTEQAYWDYIVRDNGEQSIKDPYGYIDGGRGTSVGAAYQNIVSQSLKGQALIFNVFPQLTNCIPVNRLTNLVDYAERWVTNGSWTLPDPAAPSDGVWANYGVTYGPNGGGSYIADSVEPMGRFPTFHAQNADGGQYKSLFVEDMWDEHFTSAGGGGGSGGVVSPTTTVKGGRGKGVKFR